jgi:cell division cycle protein 37
LALTWGGIGYAGAGRENLELSDDEDSHPGAQFIEESTLRRMKRMTHERNEGERSQKEQDARDRLNQGVRFPLY